MTGVLCPGQFRNVNSHLEVSDWPAGGVLPLAQGEKPSANLAEGLGETRDKVGQAVGMDGRTYEPGREHGHGTLVEHLASWRERAWSRGKW